MSKHSWTGAATDVAIEIVVGRSPEHFNFGMYSWLDIPAILAGSGIGMFGWFESEDECGDFIVDVLTADGPEGPSPDAATAAREIIEKHGLLPAGLEALTALKAQGIAYSWAGSLAELLSGDGDFVKQVRGWFRDDESHGSIADDESADFLAWLPTAGL